ncbi:MAG: transglycosylase domain-containing protein [Clostridiales Family XIII bacterium]|jgi:penicillin-binding protein 1A|nr:transglycosylase domain-containing protein [Clostridiales Family XIII bacterium]
MKSKNKDQKIIRYLKILWMMSGGSILFALLYIYSVNINLFNLYGELPNFETLENPVIDNASKIYTSDGVLIGKFYKYNRSYVNFKDISPKLLNALIVTEDKNFYNHSGISLAGLLRAGFLSLLLRMNRGGGSTITQQLAKILFQTRTSDQYKGLLSNIPLIKILVYKTKEWITAIKLERLYSKQELLSMYLNTACFSANSYGIEAAANNFFDCSQANLTYDQAAILIALLKGPSFFNPIKHPARTQRRRNHILLLLYQNDFIAEKECEELKSLPIQLSLKQDKRDLAPYFKEHVKKFVMQWSQKFGYDIYSDGLQIYTTLDSRVQRHAEDAVYEKMQEIQNRFDNHLNEENPWIDEDGKEIKGFIEANMKNTDTYQSLIDEYGADKAQDYLYEPRNVKLFSWDGEIKQEISPFDEIKYNKHFLHTGLVAIDPYKGEVKAWVGGINFKHFKYDHVKQGRRQPGSAFKHIVYATALDNGMSPRDMVVDMPITFHNDGNVWTPKNVNNKFSGEKYTLRQALSRSINSVSAFLLKKFSPRLIVDYAYRLGITTELQPFPSLCLGSQDVSVFELTNSYCTFMNKGIKTEPNFISCIKDKYGKELATFVPMQEEAISESTAENMVYMLRGAVEEVGGTFVRLSEQIKKDNQLAGKTGTTSNQSDCWCIGMIHGLCTGIWVGGENRCIRFKHLKDGAGATVARPIWESFTLKLYDDPDVPYKKSKL